jgi:hypothetical protein
VVEPVGEGAGPAPQALRRRSAASYPFGYSTNRIGIPETQDDTATRASYDGSVRDRRPGVLAALQNNLQPLGDMAAHATGAISDRTHGMRGRLFEGEIEE